MVTVTCAGFRVEQLCFRAFFRNIPCILRLVGCIDDLISIERFVLVDVAKILILILTDDIHYSLE